MMSSGPGPSTPQLCAPSCWPQAGSLRQRPPAAPGCRLGGVLLPPKLLPESWGPLPKWTVSGGVTRNSG